jgi:hypothetical protein
LFGADRAFHSTDTGLSMTNPDDWWRQQTSAQPHDRPHDRQTAGLPLEKDQSGPSLGPPTDEVVGYTAPPNPFELQAGLILAAAFVVFLFSALIFPTLYPMASVVAVAAGFATNGALRVLAPSLAADSRLPFAMLATVIVFWPVMRLDHRLAATVAPYRILRHIARVFLIACVFSLISLNDGPGAPRSIAQARLVMADSHFLPVLAVTAVLAHLLLTKASRLRATWDWGLELVRLRPSDLPTA